MNFSSLSVTEAFERAVDVARKRAGSRTPVLAVAGPQGSGKSTLLREAIARDGGIGGLSLDDVYLRRSEREALARAIHPLLATRGPPGTHDLALLETTLTSLTAGGRTCVPSFDKLTDDRRPQADWPVFEGAPSLIVVEGWCLGATPEAEAALLAPINRLEAEMDQQGRWRRHVNSQLAGPYQAAFMAFDAILFLKAPRFEIVQEWRGQQERELRRRPLGIQEEQDLARFIQHYERITRHMLQGGVRADVTAHLADIRGVTAITLE